MTKTIINTVKEFFLYKLRQDYEKRANTITGLVNHIDTTFANHLCTTSERSKYIKIMNELITDLNANYNERLDELTKNKFSDDAIIEKKLNTDLATFINIPIILTKTQHILSILNTYKILSLNNTNMMKLHLPLYEDIDDTLLDLVKNIGSPKISDALQVIYGFPTDKIKNILHQGSQTSKLLFDLLDQIFIPLYLNIKSGDNSQITITHPFEQAEKYDILLINFFCVKIPISSIFTPSQTYIEFYGYFKSDSISSLIRTSEICNKLIYIKKTTLSKATKNTKIPPAFVDTFLKNMTIGELLEANALTFPSKLGAQYSMYQKYISNNNFKTLFTDFIQADLKTKFTIIRLILMSDQPNNAGLLFSFIKDTKTGSTLISDIFYKNLNFPSQAKIHKANVSIKAEIEKINNISTDDIDIKKQIILNKSIPPKIKKLALEKLEEMKTGNTEYYKQLLYVKTIADFPWVSDNDIDIFSSLQNDPSKWKETMENTKETLNKKVYGHKECKDTIIQLLGKWFSNPKSIGKAIGLSGPPGVGKTLIAKGLGDALNIPFTQINLGGMEDGSVLSGHSITYSGAVPGLIVKKMVEAGKPRCIIFFDELDKTSFHHGRNEVQDILIHVIDPNSNTEYNDKFFQDVRFPINKVLFIFSFNDRSKIDRILLDRMEIIDVKAYSMEDKQTIIKNYMLEEIQADIGLSNLKINIDKEQITYLIESFTNEAGVRNIRRKIENILLKLNKDRIYGEGPFEGRNGEGSEGISEITIDRALIDKYLTKPNIQITKIHTSPEVGVVNGLYATSYGSGGIIPILVYKNNMGANSKFDIKLTGKQGKVMQESIKFAYTIATRLLSSGACNQFFKSHPSGLHVHTPDGATDKDGPSAGSGFTLAFISKILNKKIKHNVAMTGEININGNISAIGGLDCKLEGAKRAGVKLVFVPKENEDDLMKIKESHTNLFDDGFRYIIVNNIIEIVDMALIEETMIVAGQDVTYDKMFDCSKYLESSCNIICVENDEPIEVSREMISEGDEEDKVENIDNNVDEQGVSDAESVNDEDSEEIGDDASNQNDDKDSDDNVDSVNDDDDK